MRLSINKSLLYVLDDISVSNKMVSDSRLNEWFLTDERFVKPKSCFIEFYNWLIDDSKEEEQFSILQKASGKVAYNEQIKGIKYIAKSLKISNLYYDPVYSEYSLKNVLGIVPPEEPRFHRVSNIIDICESDMTDVCVYEQDRNYKSTLKMVDGMLGYKGMIKKPYLNPIPIEKDEFISANDELYLKDLEFFPNYIHMSTFKKLIGEFSKKEPPHVSNRIIDLLKQTYRIEIHPSVILWTYYLDIFKDWQKTVNELKPAVYTYYA